MSYFINNESLAFGVDLSRYNTSADGHKRVNFDALASHSPRVVFAAMRAGISWGYQDPWFGYYFGEAQRVGILRMPYHVLYPAESAPAQMDHFLRIVGEPALAQKDVRLVLDVELAHDCSAWRITRCLAECLALLLKRTGRLPLVYSRASWVDAHVVVADLPRVDWWLAQYRTPRPYPLFTPEFPAPPSLPQGVGQWLIHQTAEKAPAIGASGCYYMDYDRWNGSEADVRGYFGAEPRVICPLDGEACPTRQSVALHLMQNR